MSRRHAHLQRIASTDHGTLGVLATRDLPDIHVIEPPWRDNRRNRSCVPPGTYRVVPHRSPRFGRCLLVTRVQDRSHILIHAGNVGGDVERGYHTHTLGCLLPGMLRGELRIKGRAQRAVLSSRTALRRLMSWTDGREFTLEISNA